MKHALALAEQGRLPDFLIRAGIRRLLTDRLAQENAGDPARQAERLKAHVETLRRSPIAVETRKANEQHYELPPDFFRQILGRRLKYSACLWPEGTRDLDAAEEQMLELTGRRAQVCDGRDVLERGCGGGSLTLWLAERFPHARITAVSNSRPQREFIQGVCAARNFRHVEVITADMNGFDTAQRFDRVVSVEMFEHMRNYEELMARIARWLKPDGRLFVHIFVHRQYAYLFEPQDETDWMARYFFTGGQMPADDLLLHFQRDLALQDRWPVNGQHYAKTLLAWLAKMDAARTPIMQIMRDVYGDHEARILFNRWRIFLLACAELFAYGDGGEWYGSHYLFGKR